MFEVHLAYNDVTVNSAKILDKWIHHIGNDMHEYDRKITYINKEKNQFISYLIVGNKVNGYLVYGFKNLHIYLKESLKMNMIPTIDHIVKNLSTTHLQIASF